jgi:carbamoyltransferase
LIILGLSHLTPSPVGHDTTAALVEDGVLRSAVSEERFSRIKHHAGYPSDAIKYCLNEAGITLSDVDKVAVGWGLAQDDLDPNTKQKFSSTPKLDELFRKTPIEKKNPIFYNHHYIHARTAYSMTNFKKAVVISLDGGGIDNGKAVSGGIFVIDNGNIEPIVYYPAETSLGNAYGCFTEICGFMMIDGEGKTMSLAAFAEGESNEQKDKVYSHVTKIFPRYSGIEYLGGGVMEPLWQFKNNTQLAANIDDRVIVLGKMYKRELIAWAVQKTLEDIVIGLVTAAVEMTELKNVILTGGIFLNMIMNMKIREKLGRSYDVFFNPICGDLGNAVGAAFEQYCVETGKNIQFQNMSLYIGPSYQDAEVLVASNRLNLKLEKIDKIQMAIDLITKGKVVGWFQGRSELGPRGLGNRSILSLANDMQFKDTVNMKVKKREPWRPFCPSIIEQKSNYFLENNCNAPYMILGFRMKNREEAPAVCHIDGTCRPQVLQREINKDFYDVVKGSGGILLNTSLNLAGDPIVETPLDALLAFQNSKMDALIINDYMIKR